MSLYKQLTIALFSMSVLAMAATFWINFSNTQNFLINQMQIQTEDSATALGITLQPDLASRDLSGIETTVNAVFDRGFYSQIKVQDADGIELFSKEQPVVIDGVPAWFTNLFRFDTPTSYRELSAGWALGGLITVAGHPGYAYEQLWSVLWSSLAWYAIGAVMLTILGYFGLRALLSPLNAIVTQAQSIIQRKFGDPLPLPQTTELKTVVTAMNRMTENVKTTFQDHNKTANYLRELAYKDSLTGLGNRRYFDAHLDSALPPADGFSQAALFLIQLHDFKGLNNRKGYKAGDLALTSVAKILKAKARGLEEHVICRLNGADFAIYANVLNEEKAEAMATDICHELSALHQSDVVDVPHVANLGLLIINSTIEKKYILSLADAALREAQQSGENSWLRIDTRDHENSQEFIFKSDWLSLVSAGIKNENLALKSQEVVSAREPHALLHREIFAQLLDENGNVIPARDFIAATEQLKLTTELDKAVVTKTLQTFAAKPEWSNSPISINLSVSSVEDPEFVAWLANTLDSNNFAISLKLVFEFSETAVRDHLQAVREFSSVVASRGHAIALDQFGKGFSDFGYLRSLQPVYVKIDRIYTDTAASNEDTKFFITSLRQIMNTLGIGIIAQHVETKVQWETLDELSIDGVQGYAISKPV